MSAHLRSLARALGGEIAGGQVVCPGPGHSSKDRSLCVKLSATSPDGFVVFSHAGDDIGPCKDHVRARLGLPVDGWKHATRETRKPRERPAPKSEDEERREAFARGEIARIVGELEPVLGSRGESYLRETRRIDVDAIADVLKRTDAIGWHSRLRFDQPDPTRPLHERHRKHFGCIVGVMTDPITGQPTRGVSRSYITADLKKLGKAKSWGPAGVVRLDEDAAVTYGLGLAEGLETALAAMARGFRPVWSTGSCPIMAKFPLLARIEALTLFADHDENGAGLKAAQEAQARWIAAHREARVFMTDQLGDINDLEDAP
jgi:hypothetical protein